MASRRLKGLKIERLLGLTGQPKPLRVLEIGTGSGGIAHYFGTHPHLNCEVDAVDVHDNRVVTEGYRYHQVQGTQLPFADDSFDVVVTNHVIEHVGDKQAQCAHLSELHRVLRPDGVGYLAVPSRWMLVEPHYRLLLLSWLPQPVANAYVRLMGKGSYYDCRPLTTHRIESMLDAAGFTFVQKHGEALLLTFELERPDALIYRWILKRAPNAMYAAWRRAFPTLIYTLRLTPPVAGSRAVADHA
ncbi:methyltransferase type 11 [Rhodanobacter sp. C01]|nr:methyltransferase type 11 [Rhodanobacter sp. C01]